MSEKKFFYTNVLFKNNNIYLKGYKDNGEEVLGRLKYDPYIFIEHKEGDYKSLFKEKPLKKKTFENINDLKNYIDKGLKNYHGLGVGHNSVKFNEFANQFISDQWTEKVNYNIDFIKIFDFDIETTADSGFPNVDDPVEEVLSIACSYKQGSHREYKVFGQKEYFGKNNDFEYIHCNDEEGVLLSFLNYIQKIKPDIVTGWYLLFDIPYICSRIENYYNEAWLKKLSPFNIAPRKTIKKVDFNGMTKEITNYKISGLAVLDYLDLYKKFTYVNRESYKLDFIAHVELNERKLDYSEYGSLNNLWKKNWDKFIDYNYRDVLLVDKLNDKLHLIELAILLSYLTKTNFEDAFSPIKLWENHIYNYLIKDKIVIPLREEHIKDRKNKGGLVKDPKIGFSSWVVTSDATSLYPSIMMSLNISPDTIIGKIPVKESELLDESFDTNIIKKKNYSLAGNGALFDNSKTGFATKLITEGFNLRKHYKNLMLDIDKNGGDQKKRTEYYVFQLAIKIFINSFYGVFAKEYFLFYNLDIAEAITLTGQLLIQKAGFSANKFLNEYLDTEDKDYVVFGDTDSIAVELDDVLKKNNITEDKVNYLDKFYNDNLDNILEKEFNHYTSYCNYFQNKISFKREKIAQKLLIIGKKNYYMAVLDDEGKRYDEPKYIYKGLKVVKSDTPEIIREKLKICCEKILLGSEEEVQDYLKEFEKEYRTYDAEDIAFPRGVTNVEKHYDSLPIHVRASLVYNKMLHDKNLTHKYETIKNGDKIKYIYLKEPNPTFGNVIGFKDFLPKEFELEKYFDYTTMYQKSVIRGVEIITEKIGWSVKKINKLF